jgi:hypothetical protein
MIECCFGCAALNQAGQYLAGCQRPLTELLGGACMVLGVNLADQRGVLQVTEATVVREADQRAAPVGIDGNLDGRIHAGSELRQVGFEQFLGARLGDGEARVYIRAGVSVPNRVDVRRALVRG